MSSADAYHAMVSDRPHPPMTGDEVVRRLREGSGSQFDPAVVDAFRGLDEAGGSPPL